MRLLFDDELIENIVFLCATGRRPGVALPQIRRFHRERERVYSILDPDERNAAFARVHADWFREWAVDRWLAGVVAGFPMLERSLQALAFRKACNKSEENADLYVNAHAERHGIVAVRPEQFEREDALRRFLNHELMHISDMVDPAFGYSRDVSQFGQTTSQQRLVRERYRVLWDVTIDGRLTRIHRATVASMELRQDEFERAYGFLDPEKRRETFASLWGESSPRHRTLLDLAADPRALNAAHAQAPGASCPLCGFATFEWVDRFALNEQTAGRIQKDFPAWTLEQGACRRCVETYEASYGFELPAAICL